MVFNRPNQKDYYDDENLMTIVDYQTPRREEDLSHQNSDKSIAIETSSGSASRVVEDKFFVTERFGPIRLASDQIFTPISYIEAGELVSIEVVTDNPYLQVYLELDDYKNKEPKGITAAELITRGRSEYSERHFYVEDRGTDSDYVMKYHPRKTDVYKERIQIILSNSIKKTKMLYGAGFSYLSRGGLPAPATLPFKGGGTFESPGMNGANLDTIQAAITRPFGTEAYAAPNTYNAAALDNTLLDVAALHPYLGEAGRPLLSLEPGVDTTVHRAVFFPPGVQATSTSGAATINATAYPGTEGATSQQQIMVYATATEVETVATGDLSTLTAVTDNLYVRDGSKVHFPGNIVSIQRYNTGTSAFVAFTGANGDGAYLITVSPGLNYTPDKVVLDKMSTDTDRSSTKALGVVTPANAKPAIVIREVIVRRKKQKSLVG